MTKEFIEKIQEMTIEELHEFKDEYYFKIKDIQKEIKKRK